LQLKRTRQHHATEFLATEREKPPDQVLAHLPGCGCGLVLSSYS